MNRLHGIIFAYDQRTELRELTDSALMKLQAMSDAEFSQLELYPDFDE